MGAWIAPTRRDTSDASRRRSLPGRQRGSARSRFASARESSIERARSTASLTAGRRLEVAMSSPPVLRLTVYAVYRSGSEVLLADSGPLPDLGAVRTALSEIDDQ